MLVVDDAAVNRDLVRTVLRHHGRSTVEAEGGEQALALLAEARLLPDLVLTDLRMPGMDGTELADAIWAEPATETVPVLFYTAGYPSDLNDRFEAGRPVNIVRKDGDLDALVTAVEDALRAAVPGLRSAGEMVALLDQLPAVVAYWDRNARNRFANYAYLEWFGLTPADMRGMHMRDVLGARVYAQNKAHIARVLAGEAQSFDRVVRDASGSPRYAQVTYRPHIVGGTVEGFFVLASDITERVEAEAALARSIEQVALLDERERIAADLHDLVIQRLYAVGLELQAIRSGAPAELGPRLHDVVEGIDDAIEELRSSVHRLKADLDRSELTAATDRVLRQAARTLGFEPRITYSGALESVASEIGHDLLAVLQEALSNVARHSGSTQVEVHVSVDGDELTLRVTDNGSGVSGSSRRSGLANMQWRAERLGGTFTLQANRPTGTVVTWRVPAAGCR